MPDDLTKLPLVLMMVRWPEAGRVKPRLSESLGAEQAADFYRLMVEEQAAAVKQGAAAGQYRLLFYVAPVEKLGHTLLWLNSGTLPVVDGMPQPDGDLGKCLEHAMHWGFEKLRAPRVIVITADCAGITEEIVSSACKALENSDAVVGRASDGGTYLCGFAKPLPGFSKVWERRPRRSSEGEEPKPAGAPVPHLGLREWMQEEFSKAGITADASLPVLQNVETREDIEALPAPVVARLRDRALMSGIFVEILESDSLPR